jgi:hypothetical protein
MPPYHDHWQRPVERPKVEIFDPDPLRRPTPPRLAQQVSPADGSRGPDVDGCLRTQSTAAPTNQLARVFCWGANYYQGPA